MVELDEIVYSRGACIAAVRDYYQFLAKMYLDESEIIEPPQGGWPFITSEILQDMGKSEEVISLLRHLPYIRIPEGGRDTAQGAPWCEFADWQSNCHAIAHGKESAATWKRISEDPDFHSDVPSTVVGLTSGGLHMPVFLLDTERGIIYWPECPGEIKINSVQEMIEDDTDEYAPENEVEWREAGPAWAINEFFEVLKDQFRNLHYVPINSRFVVDEYTTLRSGSDGMLPMLRDIYRDHGWPDLNVYRKQECLEAVHKALQEFYPDYAEKWI